MFLYNYCLKAEPAFHTKGAAVGTFVRDRPMYVGAWVRFKVPNGEEKLRQIIKIKGFTQIEVNVYLAPDRDIDDWFPLLPEGTKDCKMTLEIVQSRQYYKIPTSNIKKMIQAFKFKTIIQKKLDFYGMEDVYFLCFREAYSSDSLWPYETIPDSSCLAFPSSYKGYINPADTRHDVWNGLVAIHNVLHVILFKVVDT
jgi:hypothetical protein